MTRYPGAYPITRRKTLSIGGGVVVASLAGCTEDGTAGGGQAEEGNESVENGYAAARDAINAAADPWRRSAQEVTQQMVDAVVGELGTLLKASIRGSSFGALKSIVQATQTAFEQLLQGQQAFEVEMVRSDARAAVAGNSELKSRYPDGYGYNGSKPYYPLFQALADAFDAAAREDSEANRSQVRETGKTIETVFVSGYRNRINQHIPGGSPSGAESISGDEPLAYSLKFLYKTSQWAGDNV